MTTSCPESTRLGLRKDWFYQIANHSGIFMPRNKCVELIYLQETSSRGTRLRVALLSIGGMTLSASCITIAQHALRIASLYPWPLFTMSYTPDPFVVKVLAMYKNDTASTHMARLGGGMAGFTRPTALLSYFDLILVLPCFAPSVVAVPSSLACMFPPPLERDLWFRKAWSLKR